MKKIATSRKRVQIGFKGLSTTTNEELADFGYSARVFNFTFCGGALKSDFGVSEASGYYGGSAELRHDFPSFPEGENIFGIFPYLRHKNKLCDDRIVVQTSKNKLYFTSVFEDDTWHEIVGCVFRGKACAVNYNYDEKDVLLLSSTEMDMIMIDGESVTPIPDAPRFESLAVHFERIYGSLAHGRNEVWFSDDFNPLNWTVSSTKAGFIKFQDEYGDVLKVVSFLNYLYIFREHAIFRLTAYANQSEFSLYKLFTDTGVILQRTIAVCGDKIIFLAEQGLFAFDGYSVTKIAKEMPRVVIPQEAMGAYQDNCYFLSCCLDETMFGYEQAINNALIRYRISDKTIDVIMPLDARCLVSLNLHQATDILFANRVDKRNTVGMVIDSGVRYGKVLDKVYFSPYNSMGTGKIKVVRDFTLTTKSPCIIKVKLDNVETEYEIDGNELPQTIFVGRSGKKVGFSIVSSARNAEITPLICTIDVF